MTVLAKSNTSADTALRFLDQAGRAVTSSLAKLSSGSRIVRASDDAASLAVGTKIEADVTALKQATANAGQASSVLQVADGALAQTVEILMRMKTLAVQSHAGSITDAERTFLDAEFQALGDQINALAEQTTLAGSPLLTGTLDPTRSPIPGEPLVFQVGVASGDTIGVPLPEVTLARLGGPAVPDATGGNLAPRTLADDGLVAPTVTTTGPPNRFATGAMSVLDGSAIANQGSFVFSWDDDNPSGGRTLFTLANGSRSFTFDAVYNTTYTNPAMVLTDGVTGETITLAINAPIAANNDGGGTADYAFSIATAPGTRANVLTQERASVAGHILDEAIQQLNEFRAEAGGLISRFSFAAANLATGLENLESARSVLLDVDAAGEMSVLASKQVLLQASMAMLAQAMQRPQQRLKLLQ